MKSVVLAERNMLILKLESHYLRVSWLSTKKEKKQNENKFTRLDELAHEWNKNCKKKGPYEFIEWLKMVY